MDKGKLCYACLLPKDVCTVRKCKFETKVPETLKCQGCAPWARSKNLAPFSILFCRNKEHAQLRAPFSDMKKDLEKYIGKLGTTVVDSSMKFSANYTYQAFSLSHGGVNALGWTQEDFKDKPAPSINSETGEIVKVQSELIIPEVLEHSCYLMQTIKIGGSDVLVFFDRGGNIHNIDGSLAEKEGLQQISSNPTSLTVVGGNKVNSNHGTFRFNLGPGDKDEFHEIVCIGMSDVTAGFGSYDLSEICEEFKDQAEPAEKDVLLPERVGGSKVQLLLGIKNTNLDPVLVKILPSGVAVYRSPFKDVYGSRMIFAGPHKSFTKDDNGVNMSNAVFFMRSQNPDVDLIDFSDPTIEAGKGVAEELLIDLQVEESLEDHNKMLRLSDDHEKLMNLLEDSYSLCNVHTAQINVHRGIENDAKPDTAEELLIDLEMKVAELKRTRPQPRIQTPEKVGCLEILGEKLLIDISPAELDGFRFQSGTQILDTIGYLENMETFGTCKLQGGSDLRISTNLDDLPGIRGITLSLTDYWKRMKLNWE